MTTPIYGPFTRNESLSKIYAGESAAFNDYSNSRTRYKQKAPYSEPAPYTHYDGLLTTRSRMSVAPYAWDPYAASLACHSSWRPNTLLNQLSMVAWDRLKSKLGETAELGAALATFNQSLGMITARTVQLLQFGSALKRGNLRKAWDLLDFRADSNRGIIQTRKQARLISLSQVPHSSLERHRLRKGRDYQIAYEKPKARDVAGTWLEWSFGWSPMVGDIQNALEVLNSPLAPKPITGSASTTDYLRKSVPSGPGSGGYTRIDKKVAVRYGADVEINNPNMHTLNQLGLINPATVIWELIPFSFVVDWFVNVEQSLSRWTDFYGCTLTRTYTTYHWQGTHTSLWGSWYPGRFSSFSFNCTERTLGFIPPTLGLRKLKLPGLKRAANAASLLAVHLKSV